MPDLIRHPDIVPTPYQIRGELQSGTISNTGSRFSSGTLDSGRCDSKPSFHRTSFFRNSTDVDTEEEDC